MNVIIVLGEKLPKTQTISTILENRLKKTLEVYTNDSIVIVSGGRVETKNKHTEAYEMKKYLKEYIPHYNIIKDLPPHKLRDHLKK